MYEAFDGVDVLVGEGEFVVVFYTRKGKTEDAVLKYATRRRIGGQGLSEWVWFSHMRGGNILKFRYVRVFVSLQATLLS